jgi:DNA-binding CsgD family transcriptional regulator
MSEAAMPHEVVFERALFDQRVLQVRAAGIAVADGWQFGSPVCAGVVDGSPAASDALLVAARGTTLLVHVDAAAAVVDAFVDDLRRIGPVQVGGAAAPDSRLSAEQQHLLDLLAAGHTLAEAARAAHLSLRTASRRLATSRAALGVATTAEAVVRSR